MGGSNEKNSIYSVKLVRWFNADRKHGCPEKAQIMVERVNCVKTRVELNLLSILHYLLVLLKSCWQPSISGSCKYAAGQVL